MHIAVIMDGNRRWAQSRGFTLVDAYGAGINKALEVARWCIQRDVNYLTIYALSLENFRKRPESELGILYTIISNIKNKYIDKLNELLVKVVFIGDTHSLPGDIARSAQDICDSTKENLGLTLRVALNYSGRQEIILAARRAVGAGVEINEESLAQFMYDASAPYPDILIRTGCDGGRIRISNFMLWQIAYTELFFIDTLWPDYSEQQFNGLLEEFKKRPRLFGK